MARLRGHAKIATPVSAKSQRAVWLLPLLTWSAALACGRAESRGNDGESDFVDSCDRACAAGTCNADADCMELGNEHRCIAGACRSGTSGAPVSDQESPASLPVDQPPMSPAEPEEDAVDPGPSGAGGSSAADEFFPLAEGATCADLQNGALDAPLTVHVRNERSQSIYLERHQQTSSCFMERQLVRVQRANADVAVTAETRCALECAAYVADPGRGDTPACIQPACDFREVVPIEPGGELVEVYDREWSRFRLFLPPECRAGVAMDPVTNGYDCLRYGALAEGEYTLTAKAFTAFLDGGPIDNYCTPPAQYDPDVPCFTGVEGTEITAQAITTTPHGDIDIVFTE